ncbi:MAG: hypothetical protein KatS3mg011_0377 [Acidimicrobiia bacterium]|nr:MAG: hypothetical protein KatS3mg011_0377 [Acidimicrobiia bacterium]
MTGTHDTVLVVDLGAQYARLIARRVREANVHSEIVPRTISAEEVRNRRPSGVILSGGPASVYADDAYLIDRDILTLGIPVLGICYGHQLHRPAAPGGSGGRHRQRPNTGRTDLEVTGPSILFRDLPSRDSRCG